MKKRRERGREGGKEGGQESGEMQERERGGRERETERRREWGERETYVGRTCVILLQEYTNTITNITNTLL